MSAAALLAPPAPLETARAHHARNELLPAAQAYRETLQSHPRSPEALLGLSLIARQSNQLQPALNMAQAALAAAPGSALAWANYGDCLLAVNPQSAGAQQAQAVFRRALALDSQLAAAHYGLGNTLAIEENYPAALPSFETAAELAPNLPEFHFAVAFALGKLGRHADSIAAYRRAVTLRPGFASAWLNLGVELVADGRDDLASPCYRQALASAQGKAHSQIHTQISARLNLGHLHRSRRDFPQAGEEYEQALALAPSGHTRCAEVHVAFAYLHLEQQEFAEAWQSLQAAEAREALDPSLKNPEVPNARGILLLAEDSAQVSALAATGVPGSDAPDSLISQAIAAFQQAESHGHKTAASNLGNALLRLGRVGEALEAHRRALALDPCHPGVRYNLALTQLRAGQFAEGWLNYEIRWKFREVHPHPRRFQQPLWYGEELPAPATLFLYAEQGLGDTLQFLRYLALVAERLPGARLLLEVQPPVARLVTGSLAQWTWPATHELCHPEQSEGSASRLQILTQGDPLPPFTHHCPLMSLPAVFQTTLDTVPAQIPYLRAPETHAGAPLLSPPQFDEGGSDPCCGRPIPRIGLNWAGNPNYRADRERSTYLATFLPLLQIPHMEWVSLQKGPPASQIAEILPQLPENCTLLDACSQDSDLADTACVVEGLDLVVTTDTAIAHLAGAMGKPLWLLLPWQSDWRWMQNESRHRLTTPWYPTARLFRQSSPRNWPELVDRVRRELETELHKPAPMRANYS
jgi:tetratricopeptide (TPR) repeat protein